MLHLTHAVGLETNRVPERPSGEPCATQPYLRRPNSATQSLRRACFHTHVCGLRLRSSSRYPSEIKWCSPSSFLCMCTSLQNPLLVPCKSCRSLGMGILPCVTHTPRHSGDLTTNPSAHEPMFNDLEQPSLRPTSTLQSRLLALDNPQQTLNTFCSPHQSLLTRATHGAQNNQFGPLTSGVC